MSDFKSMKSLKIPKFYSLPQDALGQMIKMQQDINYKIIPCIKDMNYKQKEGWTQKAILAMMDEMSEVLGHINWKWWSEQNKEVDVLELKYELIDLQHFLFTLMLIWGMDSKEIYTMFIAKAKENLDRQKRKY